MILLGTKNSLSTDDLLIISNTFDSFQAISIDEHDDEQVVETIKTFSTQGRTKLIVLNLEKPLSIQLKSYLEELDFSGMKFMIFSEFSAKHLNKLHIEINEENFKVLQSIRHDALKQFNKRTFDIFFSFFALIVLSPIILVIAILIKILSPYGPIFFGHKRLGKDGRFFRVYKFRTMVPNAEEILKKWLNEHPEIKSEYEKDFKLKNDPRIIPGIGNFLRKTSLDELPQFFNSFIGNMSVVGPRPIVEKEIEKYGHYSIKLYSVLPGVTGLWQVSGRNDIDYEERIDLDMEYIDNQSFWLDIKIVFQTILVMLFKKGAY